MEEFNLTGVLDDGAIALTVASKKYPKGRKYVFHSPTAKTGMWLQNLVTLGQQAQFGVESAAEKLSTLVLDDEQERDDLYPLVMGDTLKQMISDDTTWATIQDVFAILLAKWGTNQSIQESVDNLTGEAAAQPANREARRANGRASSPTAGSKSSRASSATKARTSGRTSTPSSTTSAARVRRPA